MHEQHPGVQDMASETFLKLSKLTKHMFVTPNDKEKEPYINELIRKLPDHLEDLQSHQKLMVYEGMGWMISAAVPDVQMVCQLVQSLLQYSH